MDLWMGASASSLKAEVPCTRVGSAAQPAARESAGLVSLDQSRVLLFGGGSEGCVMSVTVGWCMGAVPTCVRGRGVIGSARAAETDTRRLGFCARRAEGAVQFNDLHVLDLDGKSWAPVAATGTPPSPRTGHATLAVHDDTGVKVVVLGGCSQTEGCGHALPPPVPVY